jgi:hypothetical protein
MKKTQVGPARPAHLTRRRDAGSRAARAMTTHALQPMSKMRRKGGGVRQRRCTRMRWPMTTAASTAVA